MKKRTLKYAKRIIKNMTRSENKSKAFAGRVLLLGGLVLMSCSGNEKELSTELDTLLEELKAKKEAVCDCALESTKNCNDQLDAYEESEKRWNDRMSAGFESLGEEVFSIYETQETQIHDAFIECRNANTTLRQVFVRITPEKWLTGARIDVCEKGYSVMTEDGQYFCESDQDIVWNGNPLPEEIKVGDSVVCRWSSLFWTDGVVREIDGSSYHLTVFKNKKLTVDPEGIRARRLKPDPDN